MEILCGSFPLQDIFSKFMQWLGWSRTAGNTAVRALSLSCAWSPAQAGGALHKHQQ